MEKSSSIQKESKIELQNLAIFFISMESQYELCKEVRHIVYDICVREMIDHTGIPIVQHCKHYADLVKTRCVEKATPSQTNHP